MLLALSDGESFVASWYGALKVGGVAAELYTFLTPQEYRHYLDYSEARVAIVDAGTLEAFREVAGDAPVEKLLVVGVPEEELGGGEASFERLVADMPDQLDPVTTDPDAIAIWKFTTGTTGRPKAAVHRARDPLVSFDCYARQVVGYRDDDVVLPIPKLFFGYARDMTALFSFGVGAAGVVFPDRATPERIFELIERHRPTLLVQVPTMMNAMASTPEAADHDLSCVRLCVSSGESLPLEVHRKWMEAFGVEVLEGIGSSEAYHIFISNRPGAARPGSAGQVVPGYEAKIVDSEGGELPAGEPGDLWVAGDSTALMYWGDEERSARTFDGPWIRTGDVFACDANGYFTYRGRADDLLKVGGIWVAPAEIEQCLLEHPAVRECAVVGCERQGLTYALASVVPEGGEPGEKLAGELQEFVRERLSPHKSPREVQFLDELPRTATGKIDRKRLRAVGEGEPRRAVAHASGRGPELESARG